MKDKFNFEFGIDSQLVSYQNPVIEVFPVLTEVDTGQQLPAEIELTIKELEHWVESINSNTQASIKIPTKDNNKNPKTLILVAKALAPSGEIIGESEIEIKCVTRSAFHRTKLLERIKSEELLYQSMHGLIKMLVLLSKEYTTDPTTGGTYIDLFGISTENTEVRFGVDLENSSLKVLLASVASEEFNLVTEVFIGRNRLNEMIVNSEINVPSSIVSMLVTDILDSDYAGFFLRPEFFDQMINQPITNEYSYHYTYLKLIIESQVKGLKIPDGVKRLHLNN